MTGQVDAQPEEPVTWMRFGNNRAIPSRFRANTIVDGFTVSLLAAVGQQGRHGVIELTVVQPKAEAGPPVTHRILRKLTVDQIIRDALAQVSQPAINTEDETGVPGSFRVDGTGGGDYIGPPVPEPGRGRDTVGERLERVAEIYLGALAEGRPPVKAVAEELPCSRSTAGRFVGQARNAGLLSETTQGRRGGAGDFAELVRRLQQAGGEVRIVPGTGSGESDPQAKLPPRRINLQTGQVDIEPSREVGE